jgi:hypothetical protein
MNDIANIQNQEKHLQQLAAQRQLYATAKKVFGWQFIVAGPVAVGTSIAAIANPDIKAFVAAWGLALVIADLFWFTPWQKRLRENAAKVQELFDCEVLEMPWNSLKAGHEPDQELVKEQSDNYESWRVKMPPLENWYPVSVGGLPLYLGRMVCQRCNCWWDSKQRRHYAGWILFIVVVAIVSVLFLALRGGLTVGDFVLQVAVPLSPVMLFGLRQFSDQRDSANRLDKLKSHVEVTWKRAIENGEDGALAEARNLQDEIFENRKKAPPVLDHLFRRLRTSYEVQMNHSSQHYAVEAEKALNLKK